MLYRSMKKPFLRACNEAGLSGAALSRHTLRHTLRVQSRPGWPGSDHCASIHRLVRHETDTACRETGTYVIMQTLLPGEERRGRAEDGKNSTVLFATRRKWQN